MVLARLVKEHVSLPTTQCNLLGWLQVLSQVPGSFAQQASGFSLECSKVQPKELLAQCMHCDLRDRASAI